MALGVRFGAAERFGAAVAALREAVSLYRRLALQEPGSHKRELAEALVYLGGCLLLPSLYGDGMTASLNHSVRGFRWTQGDELSEAEAVIDEGLGIFRRLASEDPAEHESTFVHVLGGAASVRMRLERFDQALPLVSEVVTLWRGLARRNPGKHEDDLVSWLVMLAIVQLEVDRPKQVLASAGEVIELSRQMMQVSPTRYGQHLARAFEMRASALDGLRRPAESADAQAEAVRTYRRLYAEAPAGGRENLQAALHKLAQLLAGTGRLQAAAAADEAIGISRELVRKDPSKYEGQPRHRSKQSRHGLSHVPPVGGCASPAGGGRCAPSSTGSGQPRRIPAPAVRRTCPPGPCLRQIGALGGDAGCGRRRLCHHVPHGRHGQLRSGEGPDHSPEHSHPRAGRPAGGKEAAAGDRRRRLHGRTSLRGGKVRHDDGRSCARRPGRPRSRLQRVRSRGGWRRW